MDFSQRNEKWQGKPRYFRQTQTRSSAPRYWNCWVDGSQIVGTWGQIGGAEQKVTETAQGVNKGKKNEVSPEDYALYLGRERCRKKHWEGYREYSGPQNDPKAKPLDELETKIDFANPPKNLAFWKPDNSPGAGIEKKAENNVLWYARKMNGLMFCAWCDEAGIVRLTSRRMLTQHDLETETAYTWNDRFPHLVQALVGIMPPKSCLLGELVAFDKENKDSLSLIGTYTKSLTPKAMEEQAAGGWAKFYIWDVAFWEGVDLVKESPVRLRYELIHSILVNAPHLIPVQYVVPGLKDSAGADWYGDIPYMKELAKTLGFEGWVAVDPDGIFGDRAYNFKGKPDRPGKFAAKVKPEYEDDFIVFWNPEKGFGEYSTKGRYGGSGVKSVTLYQLNSQGELVYIANCSSGMTEEMKTKMKPTEGPVGVWKVIYTDRRYITDGDDTNAIDFPRFDSVRTDKTPAECINPRL